jgi:hypothetical protein
MVIILPNMFLIGKKECWAEGVNSEPWGLICSVTANQPIDKKTSLKPILLTAIVVSKKLR